MGRLSQLFRRRRGLIALIGRAMTAVSCAGKQRPRDQKRDIPMKHVSSRRSRHRIALHSDFITSDGPTCSYLVREMGQKQKPEHILQTSSRKGRPTNSNND
jgi:hypothetical protein